MIMTQPRRQLSLTRQFHPSSRSTIILRILSPIGMTLTRRGATPCRFTIPKLWFATPDGTVAIFGDIGLDEFFSLPDLGVTKYLGAISSVCRVWRDWVRRIVYKDKEPKQFRHTPPIPWHTGVLARILM